MRMLWILGVLYLVFKSIPVVECFVTSCCKYQGILSLYWYLVSHKDHLHVALEDLPSGHFFSCSPVHLWILLWNWWSRHCETWKMVPSGAKRELNGRLLVWQHPLVKAYGDWTNSCWIIKVVVPPSNIILIIHISPAAQLTSGCKQITHIDQSYIYILVLKWKHVGDADISVTPHNLIWKLNYYIVVLKGLSNSTWKPVTQYTFLRDHLIDRTKCLVFDQMTRTQLSVSHSQ